MTDEPSSSHPPRSNSMSATFNYLHLDADKVLTAFGKYGRYQVGLILGLEVKTRCAEFQMLAYVITTSVHMLFALNMMIMPFITKSVEFLCDLPDPESIDSAVRYLIKEFAIFI